MAPLTTEPVEPPVCDLDVLNWRYEELERAGYPAVAAIALSARPDIDLHLACELLRAGASVDEAVRILL